MCLMSTGSLGGDLTSQGQCHDGGQRSQLAGAKPIVGDRKPLNQEVTAHSVGEGRQLRV